MSLLQRDDSHYLYACERCASVIALLLKGLKELGVGGLSSSLFDPLLYVVSESLVLFSSFEEFIRVLRPDETMALFQTEKRGGGEQGLVDVEIYDIDHESRFRVAFFPHEGLPITGHVAVHHMTDRGLVEIVPRDLATVDLFLEYLDDDLEVGTSERGETVVRVFYPHEILGSKDFRRGVLRFFRESQEEHDDPVAGLPEVLVDLGYRRLFPADIRPGVRIAAAIFRKSALVRRQGDVEIANIDVVNIENDADETDDTIARLLLSDTARMMLSRYYRRGGIEKNLGMRVGDMTAINSEPSSGFTLLFLVRRNDE